MMRTVLPILAVALSLLTGASAQAADILVLNASEGLAFHKGDILDGAHEIIVPAGGRLVLMDASGRTVEVSGPFHGVPGGKSSGGQPDLLKRLSAMVMPGATEGHNTSVGAVRDMRVGAARRDRPGNPRLIDVSANGNRCVEGRAPHLWRRDTRLDRTFMMRREPNSDWARAAWPKGQSTLAWPHGLALVDGARYRTMLNGQLSTKFITLHIAPQHFSNNAARLAWMYQAGCQGQAEALIDRLAANRRITGKSGPHGLFAD